MAAFIPQWPFAYDTLPELVAGTSPVVAQWLNHAGTLIEILESEIGSGILGGAAVGTNSLRRILDTICNRGTNPGQVVGVKRLVQGATESFWNPGTNTIVFASSSGKNQNTILNSVGVCFGTYVGTDNSDPYVWAQPNAPFGVALTDSYLVMGSRGSATGSPGLGDLAAGSYTFEFILIQVQTVV